MKETTAVQPPNDHKPKRSRKANADKATKVTRADRLMELLQCDIGVSIAEVMGEFNVLPHTARAYLSTVPRARETKAVLREGRYYLEAVTSQ